MAIIRNLFSDEEMRGVALPAPADPVIVPLVLSEPAPPQASEIVERMAQPAGWCLNPCVKCRYRGLCDDDYCAMLMHPIDMAHAPGRRGWSVYGL